MNGSCISWFFSTLVHLFCFGKLGSMAYQRNWCVRHPRVLPSRRSSSRLRLFALICAASAFANVYSLLLLRLPRTAQPYLVERNKLSSCSKHLFTGSNVQTQPDSHTVSSAGSRTSWTRWVWSYANSCAVLSYSVTFSCHNLLISCAGGASH